MFDLNKFSNLKVPNFCVLDTGIEVHEKNTSDKKYLSLEKLFLDPKKVSISTPMSVKRDMTKFKSLTDLQALEFIYEMLTSHEYQDRSSTYMFKGLDFKKSGLESLAKKITKHIGYCEELGFFINFITMCILRNTVTNNLDFKIISVVLWNEKNVPNHIATENLHNYKISETNKIIQNLDLSDKFDLDKNFSLKVGSTHAKGKDYARLNLSEEILAYAGLRIDDELDVTVNPVNGSITIKPKNPIW